MSKPIRIVDTTTPLMKEVDEIVADLRHDQIPRSWHAEIVGDTPNINHVARGILAYLYFRRNQVPESSGDAASSPRKELITREFFAERYNVSRPLVGSAIDLLVKLGRISREENRKGILIGLLPGAPEASGRKRPQYDMVYHEWHKHILRESGETDFLACHILAYIVRQFRPHPLAFDGDIALLEAQLNVTEHGCPITAPKLMALFGERDGKPIYSEHKVHASLRLLERIGLIERVCVNRIRYIRPIPEGLRRISPRDGATNAAQPREVAPERQDEINAASAARRRRMGAALVQEQVQVPATTVAPIATTRVAETTAADVPSLAASITSGPSTCRLRGTVACSEPLVALDQTILQVVPGVLTGCTKQDPYKGRETDSETEKRLSSTLPSMNNYPDISTFQKNRFRDLEKEPPGKEVPPKCIQNSASERSDLRECTHSFPGGEQPNPYETESSGWGNDVPLPSDVDVPHVRRILDRTPAEQAAVDQRKAASERLEFWWEYHYRSRRCSRGLPIAKNFGEQKVAWRKKFMHLMKPKSEGGGGLSREKIQSYLYHILIQGQYPFEHEGQPELASDQFLWSVWRLEDGHQLAAYEPNPGRHPGLLTLCGTQHGK